MERQTYLLRDIADSMRLTSLRDMARQPGVKAVYRVTVCYSDSRACNSVATLRATLREQPILEVIYQGRFQHRPLVYILDNHRYAALTMALHKAVFDRLPDQRDVTFHGSDWWLVERAAGEFLKSVMLSPHKPELPYSIIVNALDSYLPEALREIQ